MFNKSEITFRHKENCVPPEYYFNLTGKSSKLIWQTFYDQGIPPSTAGLAIVNYCPEDGFIGVVRYTRTGWDYIVLKDEYEEMGNELVKILRELLPEEEKEKADEQTREEEHGEENQESGSTECPVSESTEHSE